jgi:hypothetical protein
MQNIKPLSNLQYFKNSDLILPTYNGFSFYNIAPTVLKTFGIQTDSNGLDASYFNELNKKNIEKVALVFIDAMGWDCWNKYAELTALKEVSSKGIVSPLLSVFPSSTAPSVGTLNYNLLPIHHGLVDSRVYLESFNELMWSFSNNPIIKERQNSFQYSDVEVAKQLHPNTKTIWEVLGAGGIDSDIITHKSYIKSLFNGYTSRGANLVPYKTYTEGLVHLRNTLNAPGQKVVQFYTDNIDIISHKYGTDSDYIKNEIDTIFSSLSKVVLDEINPESTLFLIFADHGQINCSVKDIIFLDKEVPGFDNYLLKNKDGEPIYPSGSSRNAFIYTKNGCKDILMKLLTEKIGDRAYILTREEVFESGLLGSNDLSNPNSSRIGDLVIIPKSNYLIWHSHNDLGSDKAATHGGLSKEEVLSCLVAI